MSQYTVLDKKTAARAAKALIRVNQLLGSVYKMFEGEVDEPKARKPRAPKTETPADAVVAPKKRGRPPKVKEEEKTEL